ncbi:hypothetical protein [Streptomyces sp. V3I7]|uniref:hypothetical protein n=1 Tax=Streptomyces sp. V3I7 TaxID=3042278 RepID=UPI00278472C0|nr:hypothetical protein [Streptomyces sp. V3I7]MDQ0994531.1 type II secretory pathway pseudopilin PulG [Streptomyces sp. V3I7]
MKLWKKTATAVAMVGVIAGLAVTGSGPASAEAQRAAYTRQALGAGLTRTQADRLQRSVDAYRAGNLDARQVSANKLTIPGGSLTLPAPGQKTARDLAAATSAPSCSSGHLCIVDGRGYRYDYYYCGEAYPFDGIGAGTFNNNQTWFTKAKFLNSNLTTRWTNTAKDTGTADWTPVYYVIACDG